VQVIGLGHRSAPIIARAAVVGVSCLFTGRTRCRARSFIETYSSFGKVLRK
jgi:hypothetical protein